MAVIETLKAAYESVKALKNAELQQQLIEAQQQALDLIEENRRLFAELREARDNDELRQRLVFERNVYWLGKGRSDTDGPFCTRCFDVDSKLVHLTWKNPRATVCQNCKNAVVLDGRNLVPESYPTLRR